MTKNQGIIFSVIQSSADHMTAEEIYTQCRERSSRISIATVYRNLAMMVEKGMIAKISISGQPEHYDRNVVRHEHVLCRCCGRLLDVHVEGLGEYLEQQTGLKLESYDLCMRYICQECRQNALYDQNERFD